MTLYHILAVLFMPAAWAQSSSSRLGVVIEAKNITLPAGTRAALPCHSARMVWTQDRLRDRQRVVHWDVVRTSPEYSVERILDMSPGANQRVYNGFNKGRISIPSSAFIDGNFSLVFNNVVASDRGVYTCNLHHHYCQLHQSIQIQLNVTKSVRKEKRLWDGEKTVFVVLLGSSVALPCVNRRPLWRDGLQEDQQQVAHWDFQAPGVRPDKAERLVDLYASGERREYGPLFLQNKMSVEEDAFSMGDFSLTIADLAPVDKGLYSCHLTHHYCGLHERRIFRLTVGPPLPPRDDDHLTEAPLVIPKETSIPRTDEVERPRVVNVILPEHGGHSTLQLGYVLATFLLLAFIVATVVLLTRRRRKRGLEYELRRSERGHVINGDDIPLDSTELKACNLEPLTSDYKNNILKERDMSKGCNIDFDEKLWK